MSRRTYLQCLAAVLLVVALALLRTARLLWRPGLSVENVRRIWPGMTLAEVEALLGGSAVEVIDMPTDWPEYR
jgi:hypothetical protein